MDKIEEEEDTSYDSISSEDVSDQPDSPVVYEIITTKTNAEGEKKSVKEVYNVRSDTFRKTYSIQSSYNKSSQLTP
jgi:hypothetical protein